MTPPWLVAVFAVAFATTIWYLAECFVFAHRLETKHRAGWEALGRPSLWEVRAQQSYLKVILGFAQLGSELSGLLPQLHRIRLLLAVSFGGYMVALVHQIVAGG